MGSCEDPAELHEPFCSELIQDPSSECPECSETVPDSNDSNADRKGLARNGNAGCVSSGSGVQDVAASAEIELVSECVNVPSLVEEKGLEEDVCGVSKDCLDEISMEGVQSRGKNDGLVNVLETIGMTSVVMNLDGSHAHCGKQCKHEAESVGALGVAEDFVNGLPKIKTETHDEAVSSLGCKKHEELFCDSCSLLSTVEQDKQETAIVPEMATVMVKQSVGISGLQSESLGSDMKEGIDGLAITEIGNHHTVDSSPLCGGPAELEQMSCLLEGVVRPDSNDTASGASSERATEVIENRSVNLTAIVNGSIGEVAKDLTDSLVVTDTDAHDDSVQVLGCGSPKELIPSGHLPRNDNEGSNMSAEKLLVRVEDICVDLARIENDSVLDIMRENIFSAAAIETENHGKTPYKRCFEVHARLLPVKCPPSNGAEQDKHSGNDSQEADATKERGVLLVGPDIQSHNQMLPTLQQRISSESVSIKGPQSNCDQSEHLTPGCSFTEPSMGEKIKSVAAAEFSNQILSSQGFDKSIELISLTSPSEEGVQGDEGNKDSCFFSACVEGDMGIKKEESDACGTVNSGSAVDHSGDMNHEGMDHARASGDCGSEAKLLHIALPPSGRSPGIRKSSRKAQTKRTVKKCKKNEKVPDPHGSAEIFLEYARKKRSCFSKLARSSEWGLLGNVTQDFILSNGLSCDVMKSHASKKPRVGRGIGNRMNNQTSTSSRSRKSSEKHHASTGRIRLKVKIGPVFGQSGLSFVMPKMVGTSASTDVVISDGGSESCQGINFGIPNFASEVQNNLEDEKSAHVLQCFDNKPDCESSSVDVLVAGKDVEGTMFSKKSDGDAADNGIPSSIEVEASGVATESRYTDPGTSPDSEVINTVPEGKPGVKCTEDFSDGTLTYSKAYAASSAVVSGKRSKKKDVLPPACNAVDESPCLTSLKKCKPSKKSGRRQKKDVGFSSCEVLSTSTCPTASSNSFGRQELALEQSVLSRETEPHISWEDSKVETSEKVEISCQQDVAPGMSGSQLSENLLPSTKSKGSHLPRRSGGVRKERSKASNAARSRETSNCRKKGNKLKTVHKNKMKRKGVSECACKKEDDPKIGNLTEDSFGKTHLSNDILNADSSNLELSSSAVMDQYFPSDDAWVRCDDCYKWRRIPVSIVDSISETNCQWICKDNMDKAFADCSIPQEKSNAEINAELGLSDADADAYDFPSDFKGLECTQKPTSKENEFAHITTNHFSHRSRKTQIIDEIMVCHCKAPVDGNLGCGDECLNRMLNIECVQGTCPCGELCSNQQFQKCNYAKMKWDRCGKKGFGLRMEEDIPKGQFLIEYVGEVLDVHVYAERLKEYASKGHKHFYFMTLDGSEVIDACAKGNLGRFINHSCDPNCRTEKWVVNGEICIGLFALRDIKKGEEVTFDYNFVRVVGAAAKRCYCGSLQCRGYIGGDPTDTEVIDQVDSDEEFPEPVMLEEGEAGDDVKNAISKHKDKMDSSRKTIGKLEVTAEIEDFVDQSTSASQSHGLLELNDVKGYSSSGPPIDLVPQTEDATSKCLSAVQQEISGEDSMKKASLSIERWEPSSNTTLSKSSPEGVADRKSKTVTTEDKRVFVKSRFFIKTSHRSGPLKKGKFPIASTNASKVPLLANKTQGLSIKPKKLMEGTSNGHFEAVQEKLNELLDAEGGISKRKDAPKGYLKLLLLTAASGASGNGQSIQSNRELSMILDALLKTKSRMVLLDIINKNGLRMLHNIMKQYRRDFKKIPILRKLLKVLEYLAVREILTLEHISGGPPFPGMESFAESMLSLTEHDDKQVHQIARSFRDRWIPRHIRNRSFMDRDDGSRMEFLGGSNCNWASAAGHWHDQGVKNTEAVDCKTKPLTAAVDAAFHEGSSSSGVKIRKRKSRWDQPANGSTGSRSSVLDDGDRASREYSYCPHCARNYCPQDGSSNFNAGRQNIHEDRPPGFFSPSISSLVSSNASSTVSNHSQQSIGHSKSPVADVVGLPQSKFISLLPVSYGIPMSIMQQFGSPSAEFIENWTIAPGMPFYPFPPLPPLPSSHKKESPPCTVGSVAIDEAVEQRRWDRHDTASCPTEDNPSTLSQPGTDFPGASDHQASKRIRGPTFDLGRRYFRQQKWIKMPPPWIRNRNGWGYIGDKSKGGGMCSTDSGSITNQHKNSYYSPDGSCRVEKSSNYFNQHAQNLNEH